MSHRFNAGRPVCVADTECYPDYWSIGFRSLETGNVRVYELFEGNPLNRKAIASIFRKWRVITFNGINYDMPMILYAMSGASNGELKQASDELIVGGVPHWVFMQRFNLTMPDFIDHVDLISVSPGAPQMPSLKLYAGRMHSRKMQELPIEIDEHIVPNKLHIIRGYHANDLEVTSDMAFELKPQVDLRSLMSVEYGVDLRSKSDAQIAEAVIKAEIEKATGRKIRTPDIEVGYFSYDVPDFIRFKTQKMREMLNGIRRSKFVIKHNGTVQMPDFLKELRIEIGESTYRMGIGGLHSSEQSISHFSNEDFVLLDNDVTSYYPNIILRLGLVPKHIGPHFLKIYRSIYERRIAAKKAGEKNKAETLKIVLNGSFGKFGSPFSALYSPNLMIQTTITGQLAVLMLIEAIEEWGISVVSANTDGFVSRVPRHTLADFKQLIRAWEEETGFGTEETEYLSLHSRDVNNYIAVARDGDKKKVKLKGAFAESGRGLNGASGLKKNPDMDVCVDAVVDYLKNGTPIEDSIEWCLDIRKFLTVRRVTGGAERNGEYIGKALRWYYSKDVDGPMVYRKTGKSVPQSIGAKPMLELQEALPPDLDYDYYVREAYAILQDIGMNAIDPRLKGRSGRIFARLPKQKNIHIVNAKTGIAECGKERDSIRDSWIEYDSIPTGHRFCSKCRKEEL